MKIALIITGLGMGGAERQVCDLADQFATLGHKVLLFSMTGDAINIPQSSEIHVVNLNMKKNPYSLLATYFKLCKLIKEFQPDVIHSHMVHANIFARIVRLTVSVPKLICTAHNTNEGGWIRVFLYRLTDCLCNFSTNVSQEAVDAFIVQGAVPAGRMVTMHNGIDTERFRFSPTSRQVCRAQLNIPGGFKLLLAVGRLNAQKDYPNLINAFSMLLEEHDDVHLAIIGIGEEKVSLSSHVAELGISSRVHFLGLKYNVHEWMSAADIFVLSSAWEGFGLVVAEAMSCERVVVVTDCGGVKEVVGDCGILVPARNSDSLADGLLQALRLSSDAISNKGTLARNRIIERYSLTSQAKCWIELYSK